jgi:hypothetical protein
MYWNRHGCHDTHGHQSCEFKAEVAKMVKNDYGCKLSPISTRNPQANAIIERVHQTIGNMICTFQLYDN